MGWWTELQIGKKKWYWKIVLPPEVPLLFYGEHKIIGKDLIGHLTEENYEDVFIGFKATAAQVKNNLKI